MKRFLIVDGSNLLFQMFYGMPTRIVNAENIRKPSVKASIKQNTQRLYNNYQIIKLDGHVDLPFVIKELSYDYKGITTNEVLQGIGLK